MDAKGFFQSTAALFTALGTMIAALVALGVFLLGEGIWAPSGQENGNGGNVGAGAPPRGNAVQDQNVFGRNDTSGFELDGAKIVRNPRENADVVIYEILDKLTVYSPGRIIAWSEQGAPTHQQCADLLETHGGDGDYALEIDARFCVRSSGGRTAFLEIVKEGTEYRVTVWKKP